MLGEFLEISVSAPEILASLEFYQRLGFQSAPVGEIWSHPYAVLTDGRIALGLHQYDFQSPALTFVLPDLRGKLGEFEQLGIEFEFCKLADDEFNEAGFTDPDRQMITLLEARTYSPLHHGLKDSVCGYFLEYRMGVSDCQASCRFWENLGMVTHALPDSTGYAQLTRSGLNIGLRKHSPRSVPQLVFVNDQPGALAELLEARQIAFRRGRDFDDTPLIRIDTPEGLELLVRDRD